MDLLTSAEVGTLDGIAAVPPTLGRGIKRLVEFYSSSEEREKIQGQNYRALVALEKLVDFGISGRNSPVTRLVSIIIHHCYESIPADQKERFIDETFRNAVKGASYLGAKFYTTGQVSGIIAEQITEKFFASGASAVIADFSAGIIGTELSFLGLLEKAGESSDRLKSTFPRLWRDLMLKDLDMLYFMVEKPMKKYLYAIRRHRWNFR